MCRETKRVGSRFFGEFLAIVSHLEDEGSLNDDSEDTVLVKFRNDILKMKYVRNALRKNNFRTRSGMLHSHIRLLAVI